ncbi:DUF5685 family protein [Vallitalea guaymasensis]|uniref:Uncharacterized protein n=1 Tax=Vallitalea guaymasensis TaxID=1185412 RepID=A0A8J8SCA9_9FIRM|nr:DUF5685 family protein [Vallitalea guaymasensis]QUH29557.1 hypothetical protein HYG85_11835 [Vallitalea guaymasensis]
MFGYVQIDKLELKVREYMTYKGYYCGLCMALKHNYGNLSRLTLNYDMTYLVIILTSLYEPVNNCSNCRCVAHPHNKQLMIDNEVSEYCAALNIMLAYNNLKDDWKDERSIKSLLAMMLFNRGYRKAKKKYPEKNEVIIKFIKELEELEKADCKDIDKVSNVFGHLMGQLMIYKQDHWKQYLNNIGLYLGKYIYILDAYDDIEKDKKNKSYNPFLLCEEENIEEYAKNLLNMNLSFLDSELDKLPLVKEKPILDNIIYSGIKNRMRIIFDKDDCNKCNRLEETN